MGRVFRQQSTVQIASRTNVASPPTALPDAEQYGTNHADDGHQTDYWEKPTKDDIGDDNPIQWSARCFKVAMELLLCCFLFCFFLCHNECYFLFSRCKITINLIDERIIFSIFASK